jgi:hypothetical protein
VVTTDDRLIPSLRRNLKFITNWEMADAENTANIRGLTTECQPECSNESSRQPLES